MSRTEVDSLFAFKPAEGRRVRNTDSKSRWIPPFISLSAPTPAAAAPAPAPTPLFSPRFWRQVESPRARLGRRRLFRPAGRGRLLGAHPLAAPVRPARWGRGRRGLAKGLLPAPRPLQRRQAALPGSRSWRGVRPTRPSGALGWPSFPPRIPGVPAASSRRSLAAILCAAAATPTIVGQDLLSKGSGPPRYGLPPSNTPVPTGQRSYLCLPDYRPDPTRAPHRAALSSGPDADGAAASTPLHACAPEGPRRSLPGSRRRLRTARPTLVRRHGEGARFQ